VDDVFWKRLQNGPAPPPIGCPRHLPDGRKTPSDRTLQTVETAGVTRSLEVLSSSEAEQATASLAKSPTAISSSQIAASMTRSN
jgi:hypothetical protein